MSRLFAEKRYGKPRVRSIAEHRPGIALHAARTVNRNAIEFSFADSRDSCPNIAFERPSESGAKDRINHHLRWIQRLWPERFDRARPSICVLGRVALQCVTRSIQGHAHWPARCCEMAGRDKSVTAVFARST